jgi:hypothetical protein
MKHPPGSDLLEFAKDLLPRWHGEEIERHLRDCAACRREVEDYRTLAERLLSWQEVEIPDAYVEAQLRLLDRRLELAGDRREFPLNRFARFSRAHLREATIAAMAILSTIAVQGLILNPMALRRDIRTVFEMAPLPLSYPAGGAIPDTMIVLNVHADGSYSTSVFEGLYSLDALKAQLAREVNRGEYWTLAVDATELRSPFNLRFDDLLFFKRKLGINEFRFWTDDVITRLARRNLTLEELEQIIGAGQPRIEVTPQGIDIESLHQVVLTIGTDGRLTIYGHVLTMAEMHNLLRNYHALNPEGSLRIQYWAGGIADSVRAEVRALAEGVGIRDLTVVELGAR